MIRALEMELCCELCRPRAANRVQRALLPAKATVRIDIRCGYPRTYLAESRTHCSPRASPERIWIDCDPGLPNHRMVEYIEIFRAQIEVDAFRETKLTAQCEIFLVERVKGCAARSWGNFPTAQGLVTQMQPDSKLCHSVVSDRRSRRVDRGRLR